MGNSIQEKSSLLAKNWTKVDGNTYRNAITEELIDQHLVQYSSEELMHAAHTQLMGRANINHPNVVKLIYFCQDSQKGCCTEKVFRHRVFIEHQNQQLQQYLASRMEEEGRDRRQGQCFCCPIASGFSYLADKYGFFAVNQEMILLFSQIKWHKNYDKKTVKVWINSKLHQNRPEKQCPQEEMSRSLLAIYDRIARSGLCSKVTTLSLNPNPKLQPLLDEIYRVHNTTHVQPQSKKRVYSTYSASNPLLRTNFTQQSASQETLQVKTNRIVPQLGDAGLTARYGSYQTIEPIKEGAETMKKIVPSPAIRKAPPMQSGLKGDSVSPFTKQQQNSSKINFAYNDLFSTPRQRFQQEQKKNSISPSPFIEHPLIQQAPNSNQKILTNLNPKQQLPPKYSEPSPSIPQQQEDKTASKPNSQSKVPRLQRLTVNVMVESQSPTKEQPLQVANPQPSERCLQKKLAEILESQEHLPSTPIITEATPTEAIKIVDEKGSQSINQSDLYHDDQEQQQKALHFEYEGETPQINVELSSYHHQQPSSLHFFQEPTTIHLSQSVRSDRSDHQKNIYPIPNQYFTSFEKETANDAYQQIDSPVPIFGERRPVPFGQGSFGSIASPPVLMHTSSKKVITSKKSLDELHQQEEPYISASNSEYSRLNSNYNKYLKKFNKAMNPISPRSKFSSRAPFETMPAHSITDSRPAPYPTNSKYNSLCLEEGRPKSRSKGEMEMSQGRRARQMQNGQLESLYNESVISSEEEKKEQLIRRIENTEKVLRQNRKKLEKIELEKDLQREKEIIKKEMESLLKNNLMSDESNRIKEKVKYKKATFAELKAEASKILEDLNF